MIRAIALDSDFSSLKRISDFCKQVDFIDLKKVFSSIEDVRYYLEKYPVDLIFLDFTLPGISGIDFLKSLSQSCKLIFISSSNAFAAESYELNAIDYLLKPFNLKRFEIALNKANEFFKMHRNTASVEKSYVCFRIDYSLVKVEIDEIVLIEGLDNYLKIQIENEKTLIVRSTMKAMLAKLSESEFVQVHRSFIVPIKKISSVRNKIIKIGEWEVPLGNSYEARFFQLFRL